MFDKPRILLPLRISFNKFNNTLEHMTMYLLEAYRNVAMMSQALKYLILNR